MAINEILLAICKTPKYVNCVTFWGFDGSTLSHGSGLLVLFKLQLINVGRGSCISNQFQSRSKAQLKAHYVVV